MKTCYTCRLEKPLGEFHRNRRKPDGYEHVCKVCNNARMREGYAKDPAKKIAKTRQYHLDNPEWSRDRLREHHERNRDERVARVQARKQADPAFRAYRRELTRRSESKRRALKARAVTETINWAAIIEAHGDKCWICDCALTQGMRHWDHVWPLSKGGPHTHDNLLPACDYCNEQKNNLWPLTIERLEQIALNSSTRRADSLKKSDSPTA